MNMQGGGAAACVIETGWPATVRLPTRAAPLFTGITKVTVAVPVPKGGAGRIQFGAPVIDQEQPALVWIRIGNVPPGALTRIETGPTL